MSGKNLNEIETFDRKTHLKKSEGARKMLLTEATEKKGENKHVCVSLSVTSQVEL